MDREEDIFKTRRMFIRRLAGRFLRAMQRLRLYRRLTVVLIYGVAIIEADEADLKAVHKWFNSVREVKIGHNPNVTNFAAKRGREIIGFTQLVAYPGNAVYKVGGCLI